MKVLLITARSDLGGGPKHMALLAKGLKAQGVKIWVAAPCERPFWDEFVDLAVGVTKIPKRSFSFISFFVLVWVCYQNGIRVVHSHGRGAGIYSRLLGVFGVKVVHSFHGIHRENSFVGKMKLFLDQVLRPLTDKFICVSEEEAERGREALVMGSKNNFVIENGIDLVAIRSDFLKEKSRGGLALPEGKFIFGTLARASYAKGLDLFLETTRKGIPEDVVFAIAGDGEEMESLKKIWNNHPYKDQIRFLGQVDNPIAFLKNIDVYFSFSRWEGMPLGVIEALACGRPCLLSEVPGHGAFKEFGGTTLFKFEDREDFYFKLNKLIKKLRSADGFHLEEQNQEDLSRFGVDQMVGKVLQLYSTL